MPTRAPLSWSARRQKRRVLDKDHHVALPGVHAKERDGRVPGQRVAPTCSEALKRLPRARGILAETSGCVWVQQRAGEEGSRAAKVGGAVCLRNLLVL